MKKIYKLIIIICAYLAICQINSSVYAYTLEEVKEIVNYQVIENGKNVDYDVLVDASNLTQEIQIPCIISSIEDVLYEKNNILDIDFFSNDTYKNGEKWDFIRDLVQRFYRISLYISVVALITLLLYIAVNLSLSSLVSKKGFIPIKGRKKEGSAKKRIKEMELIQQWIKAFFFISLMTFFLHFMIKASYVITEMQDDKKISSDKITIYVVNANLEKSKANSKGNNSGLFHCPVDIGYITSGFGERDDGMHNGVDIFFNDDNDDIRIEVSAALDGKVIRATYSESAGNWVIIDHGNGMMTKYMHNKELLVKEGDMVEKGQVIAIAGNTGTVFGDMNIPPDQRGPGWGKHCHFQIEVNGEPVDPQLYEYENGPLSKDYQEEQENSGSFANQLKEAILNSRTNFTFETNIEGMMAFLSQCSEGKTLYLITGFLISIFKWGLWIIFFIRMAIVGICMVIAPVVVLIDAIMKVNGNKGILGTWFKIYVYTIFLKPIVCIMYYILAKSNPYVLSEYPWYMLIIIAIIVGFIVISIIMLKKGIQKSKFKDVASKNMGDSNAEDNNDFGEEYVYAREDGVVVKVGNGEIVIKNNSSDPVKYQDISRPFVYEGQQVQYGQEIGFKKSNP